MAGDAADVILFVQGIYGVHMLGAAGMAGEAAIVDLLGGVAGEDKDLGFVAAPGNVVRTRAVASLAALVRRPAFGIERGLPVGSFFPVVIDFFVAGLARFRADILSLVGLVRCR